MWAVVVLYVLPLNLRLCRHQFQCLQLPMILELRFADLTNVPDFTIRPHDCSFFLVLVEVKLTHRDKRVWVEGVLLYMKVVFMAGFVKHP